MIILLRHYEWWSVSPDQSMSPRLPSSSRSFGPKSLTSGTFMQNPHSVMLRSLNLVPNLIVFHLMEMRDHLGAFKNPESSWLSTVEALVAPAIASPFKLKPVIIREKFTSGLYAGGRRVVGKTKIPQLGFRYFQTDWDSIRLAWFIRLFMFSNLIERNFISRLIRGRPHNFYNKDIHKL